MLRLMSTYSRVCFCSFFVSFFAYVGQSAASGSNAVTLEGDIVNVDGAGNRVAALTFGPKKTVVVVGANKIVRDLDEAFERLETFASPMNNKRLDRPNPCVKSGHCEDCHGEARICRVYQILRRRPSLSDFTVIIVGEALGY